MQLQTSPLALDWFFFVFFFCFLGWVWFFDFFFFCLFFLWFVVLELPFLLSAKWDNASLHGAVRLQGAGSLSQLNVG